MTTNHIVRRQRKIYYECFFPPRLVEVYTLRSSLIDVIDCVGFVFQSSIQIHRNFYYVYRVSVLFIHIMGNNGESRGDFMIFLPSEIIEEKSMVKYHF